MDAATKLNLRCGRIRLRAPREAGGSPELAFSSTCHIQQSAGGHALDAGQGRAAAERIDVGQLVMHHVPVDRHL